MPTHTNLSDEDGTPAKSTDRPNISADHFERKQWFIDSNTTSQTNSRKLFDVCSDICVDNITIGEVKAIIKKCKNNKSPGPDGIPIEFFKWLSDNALELIVEILNHCWINNVLPDSLEQAEVVTLYKKGNVQDPEKY